MFSVLRYRFYKHFVRVRRNTKIRIFWCPVSLNFKETLTIAKVPFLTQNSGELIFIDFARLRWRFELSFIPESSRSAAADGAKAGGNSRGGNLGTGQQRPPATQFGPPAHYWGETLIYCSTSVLFSCSSAQLQ